jgi:hypothetical protein
MTSPIKQRSAPGARFPGAGQKRVRGLTARASFLKTCLEDTPIELGSFCQKKPVVSSTQTQS